jgi:hypothetical protein
MFYIPTLNYNHMLTVILECLWIVQVRKSPNRKKEKQRRLNPYNPLAYVFIALATVVAVFLIGVNGVMESNYRREFQWR